MEKVKELAADLLHKHDNKAAWVKEQNARVHVDSIDYPTAEADDIIVKTHAVAINPIDWKMQDTGMFVQQWPTVFGVDVAGEVHDVGANVTRFKKGDRVASHAMGLKTGKLSNSAFQHYVAAPAANSAIIPKSIAYTEAAVLPLAVSTAATGLYRAREDGFLGLPLPSLDPLPLGKTVLVWGGSSSVGSLAIQLAVASGAHAVAVASTHNHEYCKKLGATEVVDYKSENVRDEIIKAIQATGGIFAGVYDAIGEESSYKHTLPIIEHFGGGVSATVTPPGPENVPSGIKVGVIFAVHDVTHSVWEQFVTPALEQGKLKCVPEPLLIGKGLESIQKGLDTNKKGVSAKKVIVEL